MAKRKYVAIIYDNETQKNLRAWAIKNGFNLTSNYNGDEQKPEDFEFHTTIFFTTNEVNLRNKELKLDPNNANIEGIKFLGDNEDIPVLKLSYAGEIKNIRKQYEDLGLEDQWPSYQPHISLSYAKEKRDVNDIKLPDFKPTFNKMVIKDIED